MKNIKQPTMNKLLKLIIAFQRRIDKKRIEKLIRENFKLKRDLKDSKYKY